MKSIPEILSKIYSLIDYLANNAIYITDEVYHIRPDGIDSIDNNNHNFKTLSFALKQQLKPNAWIVIHEMELTENDKMAIPENIAGLVGFGAKSKIILNYKVDDIRYAPFEIKTKEGKILNMTISYLNFDGNSLIANSCFAIFGCSGIKFKGNIFKNFRRRAIVMSGSDDTNPITMDLNKPCVEPKVYAIKNEVSGNEFNNCSGFYGYGTGAIELFGQEKLKITRNRFEGNRAIGENGWFIKAYAYIKDSTISYNVGNRISSGKVDISNEYWDCTKIKIHHNKFNGGSIDIAGHFAESFDVYLNRIVNLDQNIGKGNAIVVEGGAKNIHIHYNFIRGFATLFGSTINQENLVLENIEVDKNYFIDPGVRDSKAGQCFIFGGLKASSIMRNYNIHDNIIFSHKSNNTPLYAFHWLLGNGTFTDFKIHNNIIMGFTEKGISRISLDASISNPKPIFDNIFIDNNIIFDNGNNNKPWVPNSLIPKNTSFLNNIIDNPLFVDSDNDNFELAENSPAKSLVNLD